MSNEFKLVPDAWQFLSDGKWHNGDDRIKDHRKNTEEAGYPTRDLYAAAEQQGEPDFYEVSGNGVRPALFYTHPDWAMDDPRYTVTPHWKTAQPTTAKVLLPERKREATEDSDIMIDCQNEGWNACLDEFEKLNKK